MQRVSVKAVRFLGNLFWQCLCWVSVLNKKKKKKELRWVKKSGQKIIDFFFFLISFFPASDYLKFASSLGENLWRCRVVLLLGVMLSWVLVLFDSSVRGVVCSSSWLPAHRNWVRGRDSLCSISWCSRCVGQPLCSPRATHHFSKVCGRWTSHGHLIHGILWFISHQEHEIVRIRPYHFAFLVFGTGRRKESPPHLSEDLWGSFSERCQLGDAFPYHFQLRWCSPSFSKADL